MEEKLSRISDKNDDTEENNEILNLQEETAEQEIEKEEK